MSGLELDVLVVLLWLEDGESSDKVRLRGRGGGIWGGCGGVGCGFGGERVSRLLSLFCFSVNCWFCCSKVWLWSEALELLLDVWLLLLGTGG